MDKRDDRLDRELTARAREGRLACAEALRLAEELGVPPAAVGAAANRLGVRIKACQLGCFPG